jgi:sensor histidine kinase YesM
MLLINSQSGYLDIGNLGWKYYNSIRKKATEQEFSWSGLIISLSVAFFIVVGSAQILSLTYYSMTQNKEKTTAGGRIERLETIRSVNYVEWKSNSRYIYPKNQIRMI